MRPNGGVGVEGSSRKGWLSRKELYKRGDATPRRETRQHRVAVATLRLCADPLRERECAPPYSPGNVFILAGGLGAPNDPDALPGRPEMTGSTCTLRAAF